MVDEVALLEDLRRGRIRAVIDVFHPEPPPPDHPFFRLPNVLVTRHLAGHTPEVPARSGTAAVDAVLVAIAGLDT